MPTQCSPDLFGFAPVDGRRVEAAFDGGAMSSDAGALLLGATDRAIRLVDRFATCFVDGRVADQVEHTVAAMVGQRVYGIALGYEDVNRNNRRLSALAALAPSVPEIRYLLARLVLRPPLGTSFIFAWSLWRRQHQLSAAIAHYKRRSHAQL